MIIGICGGSGSGKTTLLDKLSEYYAYLNPSVFSMDNYYKPIEEQAIDENGKVNFDLPTALDERRLVDDLYRLIQGEEIMVKEYHFNAPPDLDTTIIIKPSKLIIVEGLFLFHYEKVRCILDYSIFISVSPEEQLDRRIKRDQENRGYSKEEILYQWEHHVMPCYHNYLLPYQSLADFRFRNDNHADKDFTKLTLEIDNRLEMVNITS
ncbi:MAG: uridine kinase [Bacteroidetes bacterium]|nr:MAG: uridine kinase [Bacteroidota bacterium]